MFDEIINSDMRMNDGKKPFAHWVMDDFFNPLVADGIEQEFPAYESDVWYEYRNPIEEKKAMNNYDVFGPLTYRMFLHLNSPSFIRWLNQLTGQKLYPDFGLHGGGLHLHKAGGNLNPHLDYSLHPKMGKQRAFNLIVYLSSNLVPERDGGHLALYPDHDGKPDFANPTLVPPVFNRGVLFDVRDQGWHGMYRKFDPASPDVLRKSIATYYLTDRDQEEGQPRLRARFFARPEQQGDPNVLELIEKRGDLKRSVEIYREPDGNDPGKDEPDTAT